MTNALNIIGHLLLLVPGLYALWVLRNIKPHYCEEIILALNYEHDGPGSGIPGFPCTRYLVVKRAGPDQWEAVSPGHGRQMLTQQGIDSLLVGGWEVV